jgi:preprotein translocase subunit YajC
MFGLPNDLARLDWAAQFIESMMLAMFNAMLAFGAPPGTQQDPRASMFSQVGLLLIMGFVFYILLIRPQRTRAKQQEEMLKAIKAGDKILTTGGIIATVVTVKEKSIAIRSADAKLEILKSAVSEITERSGATPESAAS